LLFLTLTAIIINTNRSG